MRRNNFIEKWKPLVVFAGIIAVMVVVCLLAWMWENRDTGPGEQITDPPFSSENTGPGTSQPDDDPTQPSVPGVTDPPPTDATQPGGTNPTQPPDSGTAEPIIPQKERLSCDKIAIFSGRFAEDGSDKPVENVVSLLITNRSDQFLDMATIQYKVDGRTANFIVTGLPAGKSCWVMEYSAMTMTADAEVTYVGSNTSFRDDAVSSTKDVTISADGNMLSATNNTSRTLKNVFIYYKSVHTDKNYFGGITYMVNFGDLKPGETIEKLGGHYVEGESEIVRIGWQES